MQTKLRIAKEDTNKVNLLIEISDFYQHKKPDTAFYYHTLAQNLAEQLNEILKKAKL